MWRAIEIRNFRSMAHVQATLAPFTVVVGPNSSGKSNFVDALVFARDVARDASTAIQSRGGIASIRRLQPGDPLDVTIDVRAASTREGLEKDYVRHGFTIASRPKGRWAFTWEVVEKFRVNGEAWRLERVGNRVVGTLPPRGAPYETELSETMSAMLPGAQFIHGLQPPATVFPPGDIRRYRLEPSLMRAPQLVTERNILDESGGNLAMAVTVERTYPGRWEALMTAMRKIIPGLLRLEELVTGRYATVRFFQKASGSEVEFTATEMSEGALRALGILVATAQLRTDELLIIEEPEVAIHPGAAAVLFERLQAAAQVGSTLITTHSPELLDAAREEEILVCDYRDGVTAVGPLDRRQRGLVRDGLFSVAELMRSEPLRIDGMPPEAVEEP